MKNSLNIANWFGAGKPGFFLVFGLLFALGYTQMPLYSANQHAHLLHGLANGGFGNLANDWLAKTADPFPVFSALIAFTYRFSHENLIYLYQAAILGLYFFCFVSIADHLFQLREKTGLYWGFTGLTVFLHSNLASQLFMTITGQDIGRVLHQGVAMQYAVNHYFQPSSFTVLLLLAVYLFLKKKDYWAGAVVGVACLIYFSISLGAAILTIGFLCQLFFREKNRLRAILVGLLTLIIVLPMAIYVFIVFSASDATAHATMQDYFYTVRFPHHANPHDWINDSFGKLVLVCLAIYLVRKSRIFLVLLISLASIIVLTAITMLTDNASLALLFPWRLSTVLVPIGFSVSLAWLLTRFVGNDERPVKPLLIGAIGLVILSAGWGVFHQTMLLGRTDQSAENGVMEYIRNNRQAGDIYLTPYGISGFRLGTGAPIFVSYKSHPYKDVEVMEWLRRLEVARDVFDHSERMDAGRISGIMEREQLSHLVLPVQISDRLHIDQNEAYRDTHYVVYQFDRESRTKDQTK